MKLQFLLLLFHVIVMSSEVVDVPDEVDIYDWVEDYFDELDKDSEIQHRRLGPDAEDTIPPNTSDKSANLFFSSITKLISKNSAEDIDNLGTYSSDSTKILLCEEQKSVNFAGFRIYIRLLHHFFKDIQILKSGFRPHDYETSFEINYTAVSYENKAFNLKWKGDSEFDITKKVFYYTKFSLLGDCAGIPETLPEHPTQPIESYISRLKKTFSTEILATNPRPRPVDYDRFADDFLFKKVRVQLCEKNGEILSAAEFSKYLSDRYQTAVSFTDHAVSQNDFSNYQTVVIISVQADFPNGVIMRDNYTFRVEEKRNKGDELGWVDWWTAYVIVACPINLTPTVDPQALKDEFVGQVCGSLSPMINDGPSVESRTPFLSHMMKEEHQGFWAIICGTGNGPKNYNYVSEQFLPSWPSSYASSELKKSEVLDNTNFSFKCILKLKKVDTTISKMDFQMRAYYELNQWLVKEVRVGCEY
ncbi:hypothetical protein L5515_001982 [Caenorhabditis briggsae]|uniref:Uncharacterized protein n=1 Tax=Caenorhabditis briggsae TaxID=6238 RepID=A0AAE9E6S5_CAEBR|nr:hypothetical protein L5515_001982 [Caenorhabditis briggsae]